MGIIQANSKLPPSSNKISTHNTKPPNCKPDVENIASWSNTLGPENTSLDNPSNCELEFKRRGIHIANLNIRHLKPKIDQMKILLDQSNSIDIFGLCETFLNESIDDSSVQINGYNFERKDRIQTSTNTSCKGGGILVYIAEHVNYVRRKDIESIETESVWLEIIVKNSKPFLLCSFYRPPSSNADWFEYFSKEIDHAQTISDEIYIAGDMNVDCKHGILSNPKWKHLVELHDLQQVINCPTRIIAHSETLIDHVYVSNTDKLSDISVPSIAISDHYPICFTRTSAKHSVKRQQHKTIQYRCYKKFSEQSFLNELSTALDQLVISDSDTNSNFENLNTIILKVLNNHAPLKNKRVKKETQPEWFNDDIKAAIKQRDFNHKLKNWNQYKHWRNKTNSLMQNAKRDFFSKSIVENKDCSYLWKHIKNLDNKSTASKLPDELIIDEEKLNDPTVIIEKLNCFFSTISEKMKSQQTETGPEFDWGKFKSHVESKVPENVQFQIPLMTLENLITSIRSLDPSKATGLDGITSKIVKLSAEVISPTLLRIINTSISSGNFPETLKIAKILPIHKWGAKNDPSNYRPISILSVISKLVEKTCNQTFIWLP